MTQKINCPKCNFEISIDYVLTHQFEEKIKSEYKEKQKQKESVIEKLTKFFERFF